MKNIDENDNPQRISYYNFYKRINKISSKKNIDKNINDIISTNNSNFNFSIQKLSNSNFINTIKSKEKLKFKTSKNTPNSSFKKIDINDIDDSNKIIKGSYEYNYLNNLENNNKKSKLKIAQRSKKLFDDFFYKKIKKVYNNNKISFHSNHIKKYEQKSKSNISNKIIKNPKLIYDNININTSPKTNIFLDNSKSKIVKKNIINVSDLKKKKRSNNNVNMTNYNNKYNEYNINNINNNIIYNNYNQEDNNINNISDIAAFFNSKNNQNYNGIIIQNNNNGIEKGNKINSINSINNINNINNIISQNYSYIYNTNINNIEYNNNTNKVLIKYIEDKYNTNLMEKEAFLNRINSDKFILEAKNNRNNIRNLSTKNNKIKLYIRDNSSYNKKMNINQSKSTNKIDNKILNLNHYKIVGNHQIKKCSTTLNSKNNSRKSTPNELKIKYNEISDIRNNNLFNSNLSNIGINKINYFSSSNSNKNILYNFKNREEFIEKKNNLYDSTKKFSYNNLINNNNNTNNNNKFKKELLLKEKDKNRNKSNINVRRIQININKNKTQYTNKKVNNKKNLNIKESISDSNNINDINNQIIEEKINNDIKNNYNYIKNYNIVKNDKNENLIKEMIQEFSNNGGSNNNIIYDVGEAEIIKKNYMSNSSTKEISRISDSSSVIKVNCKLSNKNEKGIIAINEENKKNNENIKIVIDSNINNKNNIFSLSKSNNMKMNNGQPIINNNIENDIKDKNIKNNNFIDDDLTKNKNPEMKIEKKIQTYLDTNKEIKEVENSNKKIIFNEFKPEIKNETNNIQNIKNEEENFNKNLNNEKNIQAKNFHYFENKELLINNDENNIKINNKNEFNSDLKTMDNYIKNNIQNISDKQKEYEDNINENKINNEDKNDKNKEINTNINNNFININENIDNNSKTNIENIEHTNNDNNEQETENNENINNKNIKNIDNISTQLKHQESDNYLEHIITTNLEKNKEDDKITDNKNQKNDIINKNNYENYTELLCNPNKNKNKGNEEGKDDKSILTTQSRDCSYYQNELEKLSTFIKKYYSENNSYPESNIQFYLFGREIGHGAFGKVNICLHIASGHLVAMKTFVKKDLKYKETKDKLKNEVEVLSKLHHPFINQILDSFETDTHFFIVMEYVCGDLLSFIRKRNKLNEPSAKIIFKQIIEGLKYIHKKKIIHRDIKLDNILIDLTNTIKICDFGVSRKFEKGNFIYERCGTPAYIAPEIYAKIGYDGCQCDIWSAGVALYYILSGNLPFRAININELEKIIIKGEYEKIRDVSKEANDIIAGMLRVDPKKRLTIEEILKHPWLSDINLDNRYKLNIFTEAEKNLLSKYDVDYLNSSKSDLIENFTYRNLVVSNTQKKIGGNTKSVIYAPYNSCVNDDSKDDDDLNIISYLNKEEKALYDELETNNNYCKFGWRVRQANINYELSNNDDFDNGLMKTIKEEEYKYKNEKIENNGDNSNKDKTLDSIKDYEKIKIDKKILEYIENNVGYDKKYLTKCLKKNIINYSTATYYLLYKDKANLK